MSSKTFCVMPFYAMEFFKKPTHCCWMPVDYDIDEVKEDLLNGKQSTWCKKCWEAEDNGNVSRRLQQNMLVDVLLDKSIETLENDVKENKNTTCVYTIKASNKCNGACVTCDPGSSTKWDLLLGNKNVKSKTGMFNDSAIIDYQNARYIEFLGGEPFLEYKNLEILENLVTAKNTDCTISIVTNGSVKILPKFLSLLSQFKQVIICLSIDGIGPVFDYMRWPLKWELLLQNLQIFREENFDLSVSYTLSNVNLPYKEETIDWLKKEKLPYIINEVRAPWYFDPKIPLTNSSTQEALNFQDALKGIDRKNFLN